MEQIIDPKALEEMVKDAVHHVNVAEIEYNVDDSQVRAAAQAVVDYAGELAHIWHQKNDIALNVGNSNNIMGDILAYKKKFVEEKEQFRELMARVFHLQNTINAFLHQTVQMVFTDIHPDGTVKVYKFDNDVEHLIIDKASSSHGGDITGRIKFSKKALSQMEEIVNPYYDPDKAGLTGTFQEVYSRANESRAILKANGGPAGKFFIFWKEHDDWEKAEVSGMGVLGEAYFKFYINEYTFKTFIEAAVGEFMKHPFYGAIVGDNASGFLQGDYSMKTEGGSIEYGVKAAKASAMSYVEIIRYAQELLDTEDVEAYLLGTDKTGKNEGLKAALEQASSQSLAKEVAVDMSSKIDQAIIEALTNKFKNLTIKL